MALERRIGRHVPGDHHAIGWMIEPACTILNTQAIGTDRKSAYSRVHLEMHHGMHHEFGEQVSTKIAHRTQSAPRKASLAPRCISATWVGLSRDTGEHIVCLANGKIAKTRTVLRVQEDKRWVADRVLSITTSIGEEDIPMLKWSHVSDEESGAEVGADSVAGELVTEGQNVEEEDFVRAAVKHRRARLSKRFIMEHGFTAGCGGCKAIEMGKPAQSHSNACRARMETFMAQSDKGKRTIEAANRRLSEDLVAHAEAKGLVKSAHEEAEEDDSDVDDEEEAKIGVLYKRILQLIKAPGCSKNLIKALMDNFDVMCPTWLETFDAMERSSSKPKFAVSEVYSPPQVTEAAKSMSLKPG